MYSLTLSRLAILTFNLCVTITAIVCYCQALLFIGLNTRLYVVKRSRVLPFRYLVLQLSNLYEQHVQRRSSLLQVKERRKSLLNQNLLPLTCL